MNSCLCAPFCCYVKHDGIQLHSSPVVRQVAAKPELYAENLLSEPDPGAALVAKGHAKRPGQGRGHPMIAPRRQPDVELAPRSPGIGAEQPVPDRETETVVAVSLRF